MPDSTAETTNSGAMSEVFHQLRAIWRPKIHAVTEWSRIAVGKPDIGHHPGDLLPTARLGGMALEDVEIDDREDEVDRDDQDVPDER